MKRTLLQALLMTALLATATAHASEDNALVVHLKGGRHMRRIEKIPCQG